MTSLIPEQTKLRERKSGPACVSSRPILVPSENNSNSEEKDSKNIKMSEITLQQRRTRKLRQIGINQEKVDSSLVLSHPSKYDKRVTLNDSKASISINYNHTPSTCHKGLLNAIKS
jgi:hypothetical protein